MNREDRKRWASARTLADLGELTALWLGGEIGETPTYLGPPNDETSCIAVVLSAANRAGYVTETSQPGYRDGSDCAQRAGVSGFADDVTADRLARAASASGLVCYVRRARRWRSLHAAAVCVTLEYGRPFTRFGSWLSRRFIAGEWSGHCHPTAVDALCDAWQVTLIDPEWGRNSVLWPMLAGFARIPSRDQLTGGAQ